MTAQLDRIKAKLRAARTVADVNAIATHHAGQVKAMLESTDRDERAQGIQIRNLAAYRRAIIRGDF